MKVMKNRNFYSPNLSILEWYMQSWALAPMVLMLLIMLLEGANSPKFPVSPPQQPQFEIIIAEFASVTILDSSGCSNVLTGSFYLLENTKLSCMKKTGVTVRGPHLNVGHVSRAPAQVQIISYHATIREETALRKTTALLMEGLIREGRGTYNIANTFLQLTCTYFL